MTGLQAKMTYHKNFWDGNGPCLVLIPHGSLNIFATGAAALYDLQDYPDRLHRPESMWQSEVSRAEAIIDWPTDGIPTIRPNLGTIFIPAIAGQDYVVQPGQMPWAGAVMNHDQFDKIRDIDVVRTGMFNKAVEFYQIHSRKGNREIVAYHPDTQGVFDIAHILCGDELFIDMAVAAEEAKTRHKVHEILTTCLELYTRVSQHLKELLNENTTAMIHGHGTPQGVYFPHAGVRISEDTATLISPQMIMQFVLPYIIRSIEPFGGAFVHFCGYHPFFFEQLCHCDLVRAIDLGNPEKYDTRWLLDHCAATGTVLYSRIPHLEHETWQQYLERLARLINATGARCILRPTIYPQTKAECQEMLDYWHELTRGQ